MLIRDDVVFFCQDGMYVGVFVYVISVCEHLSLSLSVGMCMCMCMCLPVYMLVYAICVYLCNNEVCAFLFYLYVMRTRGG